MVSDPLQVEAHAVRQKGKKLVAALMQGDGMAGYDGDAQHLRWMREGMAEVLRGMIALPFSHDDLERYAVIGKVLDIIAPTHTQHIVQRLEEMGHRYLEEKQQAAGMLHGKYQQIALQKMQSLSRQTGMAMNIDPSALPEFKQEHARMLQQHTQRFAPLLEEIRAEFERVFSLVQE